MCEQSFQGKSLWGGALRICREVVGERKCGHSVFRDRESVCGNFIYGERRCVGTLLIERDHVCGHYMCAGQCVCENQERGRESERAKEREREREKESERATHPPGQSSARRPIIPPVTNLHTHTPHAAVS